MPSDQVKAVLGETYINNLATNPNPPYTEFYELRHEPSLLNAQITTYTYKPLVGITKKLNIRSIFTYYDYDAFNRLQAIKNLNGSIIQDFEYNYKH